MFCHDGREVFQEFWLRRGNGLDTSATRWPDGSGGGGGESDAVGRLSGCDDVWNRGSVCAVRGIRGGEETAFGNTPTTLNGRGGAGGGGGGV